MDRLWDYRDFVDDNTLTVNINRLRKKMKNLGILDSIETKKARIYIIMKLTNYLKDKFVHIILFFCLLISIEIVLILFDTVYTLKSLFIFFLFYLQ